MSVPLETLALNYWVENYLFRQAEIPDMAHEYGTYITSHWHRVTPDSSLGLALKAYSLAAFARTRGIDNALGDADRLYQRSIMKTHEEVQNPSSDGLDQLLIATMLMGHFEVSQLFDDGHDLTI